MEDHLSAVVGAVVSIISVLIGSGATYFCMKQSQSQTQSQVIENKIMMEGAAESGIARPAPINPDKRPRNSNADSEQLRDLAPLIEQYTEGYHGYDEIWELHLALGSIGVAWPGPGVTPEFRHKVSKALLEAARQGDMEAATNAWRNARETT